MSTEYLTADGVEVITSNTSRRRERNAARVPDVLPPSKDEKLAALSRLTPEQQVEHVSELLVHSHAGLLVAIAAQDLPGIAEAKQKAATIQEIAKQLRMGKDMQLHAAEFCRRAERGLGVAIREGQERGVIRSEKEARQMAGWKARGTFEQNCNEDLLSKPLPTDFATRNELHDSSGPGIYSLTDGISNEAFEEALAEAREEGNLSRSNVARKSKSKARREGGEPVDTATVEPVAETPPHTPAKPKKRLTKHNSTEMLANINGMLNGIVETLPFIDPTDIDPADRDNKRVIENMRQSMARIRRLLKEIENG